MYGSTLNHKFFVTPPIFPSEEQIKKKKKSQPTTTHIMDYHLTFFATTGPSMHPSSTIAIT